MTSCNFDVVLQPPPMMVIEVAPPSVFDVKFVVGQGMAGPPGEGSEGITRGFSFGDVSDRVIYTMPRAGLVQSAMLNIAVPWDGIGSAVAILAGLTDLMPAYGNDPALASVFEWTPAAHLAAGTEVHLLNTPGAGATQGIGTMVLEIVFN